MKITIKNPNPKIFLKAAEQIVDKSISHCCVALYNSEIEKKYFEKYFKPIGFFHNEPWYDDYRLTFDQRRNARAIALLLCAELAEEERWSYKIKNLFNKLFKKS